VTGIARFQKANLAGPVVYMILSQLFLSGKMICRNNSSYPRSIVCVGGIRAKVLNRRGFEYFQDSCDCPTNSLSGKVGDAVAALIDGESPLKRYVVYAGKVSRGNRQTSANAPKRPNLLAPIKGIL